jgi:hypothetical protein
MFTIAPLVGKIVGDSDARIVDEEVKIGDLVDCPLDMRSVGYV